MCISVAKDAEVPSSCVAISATSFRVLASIERQSISVSPVLCSEFGLVMNKNSRATSVTALYVIYNTSLFVDVTHFKMVLNN